MTSAPQPVPIEIGDIVCLIGKPTRFIVREILPDGRTRQECFESRHFEVKRNGDVLWAVSCLVARNFDGGVGPPMPSAPTLSTALMVTWRTSGDCVRAPFATILFHSTFGLVLERTFVTIAAGGPVRRRRDVDNLGKAVLGIY